ncbi:SMP-30/gluconolactonase/LRE family protein [Flagellimonas onchidii]|uniref:SMP-30/gluconolactonase/LRE family protein n=1 Tax=Flagellimonas onchidii TaxID=2562684 RepID=UPI00197ACD7B|nr:SMP-30/gluconolactonase/LRE family protein [Allomuricauda onchidii]
MLRCRKLLPVVFLSLIVMGCAKNQKNIYKKDAFVEILDNEALEIIDADSKVEILGEGYAWTEGPLWVERRNFLLFSDIPNNKVHKIDSQGNNSVFLTPSGYTGNKPRGGEMGSNALLLDKDGHLVLMQHGDRRVAKMNAEFNNPKPDFKILVDEYESKKFNSPNDGVFDTLGNLYFTDPPYGLEKREKDTTKEIMFQGIYFVGKEGKAILLDSTVTKPNGIGLSPDEKKLYVAVSDPKHAVWYQYDILAPGKITNKQIFYDATHLVGKKGEQGLPDGMKVKSNGYIFATGPGGVWIFNQVVKPIAKIRTGEATSNCAFTSNEKRLFITADDFVLAVDLK